MLLAQLCHKLKVSYCDRWMFVVRRQQLLQTISPPKIMTEFYQIWLTGMILKWPSQIIDQMVYLDHMGKKRFSKTLEIFLTETTRLIALIFCVALSSRYLLFFVQIMPMGPQIVLPPGSPVLRWPWASLQSVILVFSDHTNLLFYNGIHEKYCLKPLSLIESSSRPLLI